MQTRQLKSAAIPETAAVKEFLAQKRIAVVGVSGTKQTTGNLIFRKLKTAGYEAIPVNPGLDTFDGEKCYPDVASIPGPVGGAVIVTRPQVTEAVVRNCAEAGVPRVWMHQSLLSAGTSVSPDAVEFCREHGMSVIPGSCPMMFCQPVDAGHRCMRWLLEARGGLKK